MVKQRINLIKIMKGQGALLWIQNIGTAAVNSYKNTNFIPRRVLYDTNYIPNLGNYKFKLMYIYN